MELRLGELRPGAVLCSVGPTLYALYRSTERARVCRRQPTASDGGGGKVLSSHTSVQLSVRSRTCKAEKDFNRSTWNK